MTDADAKALSTVLDYLAKTVVVEAEKTRAEICRSRPGPQRLPEGVKLQRCRRQLSKLRRENEELHLLLQKRIEK